MFVRFTPETHPRNALDTHDMWVRLPGYTLRMATAMHMECEFVEDYKYVWVNVGFCGHHLPRLAYCQLTNRV